MLKVALWSYISLFSATAHSAGLLFEEERIVERCRTAVADVAEAPSATGQWFIDNVGDTTILCLYGSGDWSDLDQLFRLLHEKNSIDTIVVRSTGGPVDLWLSVAERVADRVRTVVVDEACFSSCANYIIPLGSNIVAKENSLIVWHGGPTLSIFRNENPFSYFDLLSYEISLIFRTIILYNKLNISPSILKDTNSIPISKIEKYINMKRDHSKTDFYFAGYAISPEHLTVCYDFKNVTEMWHAGGDCKILRHLTKNPTTLDGDSCRT